MRILSVAVVLGAALAAPVPSASAAPTWAPASSATVKPGVQTLTGGQQCTANFVFYDASNALYVGQSAHCASLSGPTVTNGCQARSMPLGTSVTVRGATRAGKLVYSSWIAMQAAKEPANSDLCRNNDFAIVRLDPADYGRVNPSVPFWGGPVGQAAGARSFTDVYSYGNSGLRLGISALSPKQGVTTNNNTSGGWSHRVYTATPGVPGDSGSAFLDATGNALGSLSTVSADGSNGVANLTMALAYLRSHSAYTSLTLATGTEPFSTIV